MSIFDAAKTLYMEDVAPFYGVDLNRYSKGLCPFHSDRNPSLSVKESRWKCFVCGEGGDAVDFVSKLYELNPVEALTRLNDDFRLGLDIGGKVDPTAARKYEQERARLDAFKRWEQKACNTWAKYCRMLRSWKRDHAPKTPEDEPNPRYIEACHKLDWADYVYETVFIDGYRDTEVQAIFYRDYRQEVSRIEQQIRESGFTG